MVGRGEPVKYPSTFSRDRTYDNIILQINEVISKLHSSKLSDLEGRILNSIELHSMISSDTPFHINFVLCVIALECLVLDKSDRDYIGLKLTKKLRFC